MLWLLLPLTALALAGAWLLLSRQTPVLPEQETEQSTVLCDRSTDELRSVSVSGPYDAPYTLVQDGGVWRMAGDDSFVFRETMLESMIVNAALIVTNDTVCDLSEHPDWQASDFGLGDGCLRVEAVFSDGAALAFRIGSLVPEETPAYYFLLEGDSRVYTISEDVFEAYANTRMALHAVADPALKGELIDRIAFTGSDPFTLEKRSDGWYLTAPTVYPLADSAVETLLSKLEGLRFAQYICTEEDGDLAALGLAPAVRTLTLDVAATVVTGYDETGQVTGEAALPAYQLTFALGNYDSDVVFYCLYRGLVVKATVFSAGFLLTQGWENLLLAAPFNAPTNDLARLTWQQGEESIAYEITLTERVLPNNELETDDGGNVLHDVNVTRNGAAVSSDEFLYAYGQLITLRAEDRLPQGYTLPDGAPLLTVTLKRSESTRQVALYPLDALHDAVAVDGVALFRVEKGWADDIRWP